MTRTSARLRSEDEAPRPVPPVARRRSPETAEDRLGAQGAWAAEQTGSDTPWTEIARIVQRLLDSTPEPEAPEPGAAVRHEPVSRAAAPAVVSTTAGGPAPAPAAEPDATAEHTPATGPGHESARQARLGDQAMAAARAPDAAPVAFPERAGPKPGPEAPKPAPAESQAAAAAPEPAPASPPREETPDAEAGPNRIVRRWQAGVRTAAHALPGVTVRIRPAARADLDRAATGAATRNAQARSGLAREAVANIKPAPAPEEQPPAPPPQNPVPAETRRILDLSGRRLADQVAAAAGGVPRTHRRDGDDQRLATAHRRHAGEARRFRNPDHARGGEPADAVQGTEESSDHRMLREARDRLTAVPTPEDRQGHGPQVIPPDTGPKPMPPLPESLQAPVGQVVARLLAQADETVAGALDTLREQAYPGGVLKRTFPEAGKDMAEGLKAAVTSDLREIALAANVSAGELDHMITARKAELAASATAAQTTAAREGRDATDRTAAEGQKTLDAIDGAAQVAEEETLRRQEAAGGAADPVVVNRRRDQVVRWIRNHVTTQITAYQEAGDNRERSLRRVQTEQTAAYAALVQREQYQVFTPQPPRSPRDPSDTVRESHLADISVAIRAWGDERASQVNEAVRLLVKKATDATRSNRSAIEAAGSEGIEAARHWAEERILAGQSWWTRFLARIRRWISEANDANEQWRVRRTQLQRDTVALDLHAVAMAQARIDAGMTQDQVLADETLSRAHRAVIAQFFAARGGADRLQFAADRLRGTVALDHLDHARTVFEAELSATPVAYQDYDTCEKLAEIARSTGGPFNPSGIAEKLRAAMDQIGTDEDLIFNSLRGITPFRGQVIRKYYRAIYDRDLDDDIDSEMSGDEYRQAMAELEGQQSKADAIAIHDAIAGLGTDEAKIYATLRNKTPEEVEAIRAEYLARYGESLDDALKGDLDEGNEIDQANALCRATPPRPTPLRSTRRCAAASPASAPTKPRSTGC